MDTQTDGSDKLKLLELEKEKIILKIDARILDIKDLDKKYKDVEGFITEKDGHYRKIKDLMKAIEELGTRKRDIMREMEKEKAEEITTLRKKMTTKIDELKSNYISSNNDRITAITQLTMLQNSQLTNELDFQSGKADKSLSRNKNLQEKI